MRAGARHAAAAVSWAEDARFRGHPPVTSNGPSVCLGRAKAPPPPLFGACVLNTVGSARLWLPWKPAGRLLGPLVKYFQCTCLQVSTTHPFPNAY